jgi:secreted PhoX family phosphatase
MPSMRRARPRRTVVSALGAVLALGLLAAPVLASHYTFPSTNDANRTAGWAHVNQLSAGIGTTDLQFVSTRSFYSCFEYRTDGDESQATGDPNYNPNAHDLYPFVCANNSTETLTLAANEYVEVRMVFGAESDERFDWTRFDVLPDAQSIADCQDGGFAAFGFENQGQCVRFVNTGKDSRAS